MTSSNTINCVVSEKEGCTRKPLFINHFGQGHERQYKHFNPIKYQLPVKIAKISR